MISLVGGLVLWVLCLVGHGHLLVAVAMYWVFRLGDRPLRTVWLLANAILWFALAGVTLTQRGFPEFWVGPPGDGTLWVQGLWLWQWVSTALGGYVVVRRVHRRARGPETVAAVGSSSTHRRHLDPATMRTPWWRLSVRGGLGTLEVSEYTLRIEGLPEALDGLLIAHVSDLHAGREIARRLADVVREEVVASGADVVLMTGDFVGPDGTLDGAAELAGEFRAPLGVYAVLGNHDFRLDADEVTTALQAHGVTVLRNRGLRLRPAGATTGPGLWLAGVDDFWSDDPDLAAALAGREPGEPCVLLAHNPDQIMGAAEAGVDLQLSGHTHGGQIAPAVTGPLFVPSRHGLRFAEGLHQVGRALVYVSRGVAGGPAVRIGAKPELALLRLAASELHHEQ